MTEIRVLKSCYDFYKLPEEERKAMVGIPFREVEVKRKGKIITPTTLYFPVDLHPDEFNYEEPQGLIFVTAVSPNHPYPNWFRVGVCSPDDLDIDLDFDCPDAAEYRQKAIEFLSDPTNMRGVKYAELLDFLQEYLGAGERTS